MMIHLFTLLLFSYQVMSDLFVTPWTITCQDPLSMGFPRQEYWHGLPFPSPRDLPNPEIKPMSPALAGTFFTTEPPGKPLLTCSVFQIWLLIFCSFLRTISVYACFPCVIIMPSLIPHSAQVWMINLIIIRRKLPSPCKSMGSVQVPPNSAHP